MFSQLREPLPYSMLCHLKNSSYSPYPQQTSLHSSGICVSEKVNIQCLVTFPLLRHHMTSVLYFAPIIFRISMEFDMKVKERNADAGLHQR